MAGGPAGDVDGPEGDAGRPGPEFHRQDARKLQLLARQEAAKQDGGQRHPVHHRRAGVDGIKLFTAVIYVCFAIS